MHLSPPSAAYVHVPFCAHRCGYCDFTTYAGLLPLVPAYFDAVRREIARAAPGLDAVRTAPLATVYFGGGTPSLVDEAELAATMRALDRAFGFATDLEATLEVNPGTLRRGAPEAWRAAGFNRASVGVQSFSDPLLRALDRIHTADEAEAALRVLARAGFRNLSVDLMLGLPGQAESDVVEAVDRAAALGAVHVSFYSLTVEEGTPFAARYPDGRGLPDDDEERRLYDAALSALARHGFAQYEISSAARPGFRCRHNLVYWSAEGYLGFGAGAHAYVDGVRRGNLPGIEAYIRALSADGSAVASRETVDADGAAAETMLLGLRMNDGVSRTAYAARFGESPEARFGHALAALVRDGLVSDDGDRIRPTRKGIDFSNVVSRAFL